MEVDIMEDENEPELTYPYEEVDHLNPPPPAFESKPDDEIEVEDAVESKDETIPASVHEVGESSTAPFLREDSDGLLPGLMGRDINSLFGRMTSLSRRLYGRETAHALVEKIGKAKDKQVNVRNDASGSGPVRGQDTAPAVRECTFAGFMKCNPIVFRSVERAVELRRWFKKTKSVFEISKCAEGKKVKFAAATLEGPTLTWWKTKVATMEEVQRMEHELWNLKVKEYDVVAYTQRFNELALMCPRMVEPKRVKVDAYICGLTDNIKGEVTSYKPADLNEAVRMTHKLMEQKSQAKYERILEGNKRKWESFQSGNSSGKGNQKDNSRQTL
ncbi:hypothetical protein Tco_0705960 [Tanacetum coccineum]|uniref:Ty3 transposon capsid-like protein domain-containing protein n=1 Tax=Tanacetum coccineum TaxID=301880 RepID=A0ABQ4Y620_9ASTR